MEDSNASEAGRFKVRAFGKDILVYTVGNGLLLVFGFIQLLIIPKYLSVEGYGYWQLIVLYSCYVGILTMGFSDGVLVRWAGKELNQIGGEIKSGFRFLVLQQLAVIIPLALIICFLIHPPLQWVGLMTCILGLIMNLFLFFVFTTQSIRQFRLLAALEVGRGGAFLAVVVLLFVSAHLEYQYIIVAWLAAYLVFMLVFIVRYRRYLWGNEYPAPSIFSFGKRNIDTGILIFLGNHIFILFLTLDRLLVSSFFPIEQFAIYAFAAVLVSIAYALNSAAADVLFPHLSVALADQQTRAYQLGKHILILCWAVSLGAYFPLAALIEFYLPQYTGSLPIIIILFSSLGFISIIKIIHITYFKLYRMQRQFLLYGIIALALAVLLELIAWSVMGTLESMAIAMLISFCGWYIINEQILKSAAGESSRKLWKDLMIVGCYLAGFWIGSFLNVSLIARMLLYIGFFLVISFVFLRSDLGDVLHVLQRSSSKNG